MCVGGSFPGATVTSTRKKAPFVSFDSARFVVKHPIYHLESSSDLPRLNAFKFRDVAFTIVVSFIFAPLQCTAIRISVFQSSRLFVFSANARALKKIFAQPGHILVLRVPLRLNPPLSESTAHWVCARFSRWRN